MEGDDHGCLTESGEVRCWGHGRYGQTARSDRRDGLLHAVAGLDDIDELGAGGEHTCAIDRTGTVWCWGHNHRGQLGRPDIGFSTRPLPVPLSFPAHELECLADFCCVRAPDETLWCWGTPGSVRLCGVFGPCEPARGACDPSARR